MIYIHVGFPKTATTFLQKKIFRKLPGFLYLGREYSPGEKMWIDPEFKHLIWSLCRIEEVNFDADYYRKVFLPFFENAESEDKQLLISDEKLTLSTICASRRVIAERLRRLFYDKDVKIIFTIRNQIDASISLYIYTNAIVPFPLWVKNKLKEENFASPNPLHTFLYYEVIKVYEELFGKENIRILLHEDLKKNKELFIKQLKNAFDMGEKDMLIPLDLYAVQNIRKSYLAMLFAKGVNLLLPNVFFSPFQRSGFYRTVIKTLNSFGKSSEVQPTDEVIEILQKMFNEGNRKLSKEYDLQLEKYGYPM